MVEGPNPIHARHAAREVLDAVHAQQGLQQDVNHAPIPLPHMFVSHTEAGEAQDIDGRATWKPLQMWSDAPV